MTPDRNPLSRLRALAAALAAATMLLGACGGDSPEKLMASAEDFLQKRDYNAATIQLKTVLQSQPENARARYMLGTTLMAVADWPSAEKELRKALEYRYPDEKLPALIAQTLRYQGKQKDLLSEFEGKSLSDQAAQASLLTEIGYAQAETGQTTKAKATFESALAANPKAHDARVGLARIALGERRPDEARAMVEEVLAQDPDVTDALLLKGELLAGTDPKAAIDTLKRAQAAAPWQFMAANNLVTLQASQGDFEGAAKSVETFRKASPQSPFGVYLQTLLDYRRGNLAQARENLLQVLKIAPDMPMVLLLAGGIEFDSRNYPQAAEHLRRVVAAQPRDPRPRATLAAAYLRSGDVDRAEEALAPLLGLENPGPTVLALAGEIALAKGEATRAAQFYERAAAKSEDNLAVKTRLAQTHMATGQFDRGIAELEALAASDPKKTQADLALIAGLLRRGQFDKALSAIDKLALKLPESPVPFQLRGLAFTGRKDLPKARENFERALQIQADYMPAAIQLARLDLGEKKTEAAMSRFRKVLEKSPNNVAAMLALAGIQSGTNAPKDETRATLEKAVRTDPTSVDARLALTTFHLVNSDPKVALDSAQQGAAAFPNSPPAIEQLGLAQQKAGDFNQALASFNKLATLLPDKAGPYMRIAQLHVSNKDTTAAVAALEKAATVEPTNPQPVEMAAQVLVGAGQSEKALQVAKRFQREQPANAFGYILEGRIHLSQKRFADAEAPLRKGHAIAKSGPTAVLVAQSLFDGGKEADGIAFCNSWLAEHPKDTFVLAYVANRALLRSDYAAAAQRYRAALEVDPDNVLFLNNLAWAAGKLGDPKAIGYAKRALELAPESAAVQDTLGALLLERGDTALALELLRKATTAAPKQPGIRLNYAKALAKSGDEAGARKELEALAAEKDNPAAQAEARKLLSEL
jgi:putative PEP-CTERM system TPR-repeat lipoprotein